jgi:hypothetical protein
MEKAEALLKNHPSATLSTSIPDGLPWDHHTWAFVMRTIN